jgi:hypothetical protein
LKLSCAAASASPASQALPPLPWWAKELKEEDEKFFPLVDLDPAGQGQEEIDAIWNALLSGPLQPVLRALREIGAAGNLFRCRNFHIGILSGKRHPTISHVAPLFLSKTNSHVRLFDYCAFVYSSIVNYTSCPYGLLGCSSWVSSLIPTN